MTYLLIGVNVGVFVTTPAATVVADNATLADLCAQQAFYIEWGAIPRELVNNQQLPLVPTGETGLGPQGPGCVVSRPDYDKIPALSAFTSMFLHGGWLHLLGNMLYLAIFGNNVEERMGRLRFLGFYLAVGFIACYGYAFAFASTTQPLVGASGAVSGVLGAYLVLYPRAPVWSLVPVLFFIPLRLPAWFVLGLWFVLQWAYSAGYAVSEAGSVAYLAHVIGFVLGVLAGLPLRRNDRRAPPASGYPPLRYPPPYPYPPSGPYYPGSRWRRPPRPW